MLRHGIWAAAAAIGIAAISGSAAADGLNFRSSVFDDPDHGFKIDGRLSIGVRNGQSDELVYDPASGRKISELNWSLDNTMMVTGGLSLRPSHWIELGVDVTTNITDDATMDDYDWLQPGRSWTHLSNHDDTMLNSALLIDTFGALSVYRMPYLDLQVLAGFRYDYFDWNAKGGKYIYSTRGFRDSVGAWAPGAAGISYEQHFSTPYLGLGVKADFDDVKLQGRVIASEWGSAYGVDHHHQRFLKFVDHGNESTSMLGFDAQGTFRFTDQISFTAGYKYLSYDEVKASTEISFDFPGAPITKINGDAAGLSHESQEVSVGVSVALY